jgi:hypothetical protein
MRRTTIATAGDAVAMAAAIDPDGLVAWKTLSGPLPLTFRRAFERIEGGTRVTIGYDAEPRGFFHSLMRPVLMSMGKRQLEGDLPKLKELIETRTNEPDRQGGRVVDRPRAAVAHALCEGDGDETPARSSPAAPGRGRRSRAGVVRDASASVSAAARC